MDIGEVANLNKTNRTTFPGPIPKVLGDVAHMDIIFGPGTAVGGIKYSLFLVDCAIRHKYIYPLKSLKTDLIPALQQFIKEINIHPKVLRTDFDYKLMGSSVTFFCRSQYSNRISSSNRST